MKVTNNLIVIVVAEIFLGLYSLLGGDPSLKSAAIGAMIGLAGGHLNGSSSATTTS